MKFQYLIALAAVSVIACASSDPMDAPAAEQDLTVAAPCTLVFDLGNPKPHEGSCAGTFRCAHDPRTNECASDGSGTTRCPGVCVDLARAPACDPVRPHCAAGFSCVDDPRAFDVTPIPSGMGICVEGTLPAPKPVRPGTACNPHSITGHSICGPDMICGHDGTCH